MATGLQVSVRLEVWDRLGEAGFSRRIDTLDALNDSARLQPVNGFGEGRASLPDYFAEAARVLVADPADPSNNTRSLVRAYLDGDKSGVDAPYAEWLPTQLLPPEETESGKWEISGPGREAMVVDAICLPYDWNGEQTFRSFWPDWIYGGKDLIQPVVPKFTPHILRVWIDAGATGTATIDVDIDGAGFQSATVAPGDSALDVENAIQALAYGITADVVGVGTQQSPWQITLLDPVGQYTVATNSSGLTGGRIYGELIQFGRLQPTGWTISQIGHTTLPHGQVFEWGASLGASDANFPVAVPAGCDAWLWFRGEEYAFPGLQTRRRVIENGYYTAKPVFLHAIGAAALVRVVIRDLNEGLIAAEEITIPADTTIQTPGAWVGPGVLAGTQLKIPPGVHEVVYRVGHIGSGAPPKIGIACPSLTEGFPEDTIGAVVLDLHTDWTTEHAASTFPLSFWSHGDGGFYLMCDFTDTHDSNGNLWTRNEKITIKRGERFDRILAKIVRLEYDWRIVPAPVDGYYLLQIFNGGTMGTDFSTVDFPTVTAGTDLVRRSLRTWVTRTGTLVEGAEQLFAFAASSSATANWGAAYTYEVELDLREETIAVAADTATTDRLRKTRSISVALLDINDSDLPVPGRDYVAGDTVRIMDPPELDDVADRVWSIMYARNEQDQVSFEVQFGNSSFSGNA